MYIFLNMPNDAIGAIQQVSEFGWGLLTTRTSLKNGEFSSLTWEYTLRRLCWRSEPPLRLTSDDVGKAGTLRYPGIAD
jgi:hypothetical protein